MKKWIIAICAVLGSTAFAQEVKQESSPMRSQKQVGAERQQRNSSSGRVGQSGVEDRVAPSHSLTGGTETNQQRQRDGAARNGQPVSQ